MSDVQVESGADNGVEEQGGPVAASKGGDVRYSTFGHETHPDNGRDRWPSRLSFYMAAVGSAVGFGNVWRFPALAADYGGGAFFVPYLMALFIIGLPVLFLEISLGQYYQTGDVGVWGSFNKRMRGVGMSSVACAYMLVVYYSMLLSWVCNAFFASFTPNDPWEESDITGEQAIGYFFDSIIGMSTLGEDLRPTRIVWVNVGYSTLTWFCIFLCLAFGLKWTGRIAYFTMGIPIVLLFVFLIRACTLPGASEGIRQYIGIWDMSVLTERPDVWSVAVSQIFFSLSVTFGTMTAYGSHCPRGEPATLNSTVIGLSNSMFSFLSGFAVFATLGYLAYVADIDFEDINYSGFSLVFGTWPVIFGTLPGGEHWIRLLFFDLFLLGIDSAFSILEGPITVLLDWVRLEGTRKWKVVLFCTLSGWLLSWIYATDAGLIFLDTIDFYVNFVMLLVGFFETFAAGWMFGLEGQIESLGSTIVFVYMFTNFGSVILASGLWFGLKQNAVWGGFVALFVSYLTGMTIEYFLLKKKMAEEPGKWTWKSILYELTFRNVIDLKNQLSTVVGWVSTGWALAMRQLIPHLLLILFINLAAADNADGDSLFGHYGSYVMWPFQVLGMLCVAFAAILFLIGLASPKAYEGFDLTVRGPLKRIKVQDTTLVANIDQSELGLKESDGDEEDATPPEAAVEDKDEEAKDISMKPDEKEDDLEVSAHA